MLVSHKVRHEQLSSARGLGLEHAFEDVEADGS